MNKIAWIIPCALLVQSCSSPGNCTVTQNAATGVATISCPDGTSVDVAPGAAGKDGSAGAKGESGTNCSVVRDADAGVTSIVCADGTQATVADGTGCSVTRDADAGVTHILCPDGSQSTVLDGQTGAESRVELQPEPAGPHCAGGGVRVLSGTDANRNGTLDSVEISQTQYVCGVGGCTVLEGSYTVHNSADWLLLVQAGCTDIRGALVVDAPGVTALTPPSNSQKVGSLQVTSASAQLQDLGPSFPLLQEVKGSLLVSSVPALTSVSFPALVDVAGYLRLEQNAALTSVSLPVLSAAHAGVSIYDNPVLGSVSLPALVDVVGPLEFSANPQLASLQLPKVAHVGGFSVFGNAQLPHLSLPELTTTANGNFSIALNYALKTASVPKLATVAADFNVTSNAVLDTVEFPALVGVSGVFSMSYNPALSQCTADQVRLQLLTIPSMTFSTGNDTSVCP